jgi:hypothetical protein
MIDVDEIDRDLAVSYTRLVRSGIADLDLLEA